MGLERDRDQALTWHPARRRGRTPGPRRHGCRAVLGHEPAAPGRSAHPGLPRRTSTPKIPAREPRVPGPRSAR